MIEQPKILVYGQPFNRLSGGGITISNLFKGWPQDRLAATFVAWGNTVFETDICNNIYLIGSTEHKWRFPLNWFKRSFPYSRIVSGAEVQQIPSIQPTVTVRRTLSDLLNPILHWLGIYHFASRIILSDKQKAWLMDYKPEIIYLQVSTLEGIKFALQLIDYLNTPTVMHIMDDWPSTLGGKGLFACFLKKKVNREFVKLLNKITCCFTISDAMAEEYKKRYGKNFEVYHNPVEVEHTKSPSGNIADKKCDTLRILYIGRIGTANKKSIISFANAISTSTNFRLDLFTKDLDERIKGSINKLNNVTIYPAIPHNQIPSLLINYDLLLLPLDFTEEGIKFAKYSLPTKASEYMLSGKPVIVFAPKETAVSKFFREHDCGYCLTENTPDSIHSALNILMSNREYCERISKKAVRIAEEKFDAINVRRKFRDTLTKIVYNNYSHQS